MQKIFLDPTNQHTYNGWYQVIAFNSNEQLNATARKIKEAGIDVMYSGAFCDTQYNLAGACILSFTIGAGLSRYQIEKLLDSEGNLDSGFRKHIKAALGFCLKTRKFALFLRPVGAKINFGSGPLRNVNYMNELELKINANFFNFIKGIDLKVTNEYGSIHEGSSQAVHEDWARTLFGFGFSFH